ncbi:dual specificity protein kinase YAK1-like [Archocentrus centrarchus]|uniref:dual specificity protein kinase YAK1-like n=1 Tax=Archocentrus centrarchus TaxID=63155 RepID=UPI0011E9E647|nr:dual specificity protein kinase YAK1-like [Archocentrus centrarchus]
MSVSKPSLLQNDFDIFEGTILGNSYKVESFLGEGSFGFVTKCLDIQTSKTVAVKVSKNRPRILEQAKLEMFILEQLRCLDPERSNIVKWNGFFLDNERICLNFELLDQSLYDYMKDRKYQGLPISEVRPILHQLTTALSHLTSMGIVHADLKPGNVMIVDRHQSPLKVKVIDFGLACPVSAVIPGVRVQTLSYRAPEVMLHIPFNQAIDMWSLGLIAVELATGLPLYPGKTEYDVLRFIIDIQGQPPDHVLDCGFITDYYFVQQNCGSQRWRFKSVEQFQYETGVNPRETRCLEFDELDDLEEVMQIRTGHHSGQDLLVSLIKQMLDLDANQRVTPAEALRHPFFHTGLSQSSSRDPCIVMEKREDQSLILCQQPSSWQSKGRHSIDCNVENPVEIPKQTSLNMSDNKQSFLPNNLDIFEGTILGNAYKVETFLGEGSFGFVTKCRHTKTNKVVAVKVIKNIPQILQPAKVEMFILEQLRCLDPERSNIVKWNGFFLDNERICLNFELLDQSLYDYMKDRRYQGLPISEVRPILHQLTNALSHLTSMGIVHADLKPGNVMVVDRHRSPITVKVIDFGLACPVSAVGPGVCVQTLWYRAPEVMLHDVFNQAIDMWSLGLIAAELATGLPLYPGNMDFDVLGFIIETQGQPPDHVLDRGFFTYYYFIQQNCSNQRWRFKSSEQFQYETGLQPQETRNFKLNSLNDLEPLMMMRTGHHSGQDLLVSLIKQMLHLDASLRITPLEVLRHPFFNPDLSQSSPRDHCVDMGNTED